MKHSLREVHSQLAFDRQRAEELLDELHRAKLFLHDALRASDWSLLATLAGEIHNKTRMHSMITARTEINETWLAEMKAGEPHTDNATEVKPREFKAGVDFCETCQGDIDSTGQCHCM